MPPEPVYCSAGFRQCEIQPQIITIPCDLVSLAVIRFFARQLHYGEAPIDSCFTVYLYKHI